MERLAAEARRRGLTPEELLDEIEISERESKRLGFVGIGASDGSVPARESDTLLAEGFGRD